MTSRFLLSTFVAVALLSGCGKNTDSASSSQWPSANDPAAASAAPQAPLPRACTLLTAEDAQAVLGQSVGQMADDPENCMWASSDHPGRVTMLMVQIIRGDTPAESAALYDGLTGMTADLNAAVNDQRGEKTAKSGEAIEGLGDAAWCSASNADLVAAQQLVVRVGTTILSLNVTGMTRGEQHASLCPRLAAAAKTALARF
jgi:hypothetical protein